MYYFVFFFFFQAEDGIRDLYVTGVQTCALPIFEREREYQREHRDADHDVGERERLYDGVDRGRPELHALEDRRTAALDVSDREQQHVRRGLRHRQAEREVHETAARC